MNDIELKLELMYLEQLAIKRDFKLDRIALDELMRFERKCDYPDVTEIQKDNLLTDGQIRWHFLDGAPPQGHELHFKRCEDSGVTYCTCMPDKTITGADIL
jgi:hypothetical protein